MFEFWADHQINPVYGAHILVSQGLASAAYDVRIHSVDHSPKR